MVPPRVEREEGAVVSLSCTSEGGRPPPEVGSYVLVYAPPSRPLVVPPSVEREDFSSYG